MFHEGRLPSGELMLGKVMGEAQLTGEQVVCSKCHRRSGMGAIEGQEVVPAITGDLLYKPLQLPTVRPPAPPVLRPAYTDESLKRAIRDGEGADGRPLSGFMPRYSLADDDLEAIVSYLKTLESAPGPGVTEDEMHFATILSDAMDDATRQAYLDVYRLFIDQKNRETRHETQRAANAPWHKAWKFKPYRKWVLHVWEVEGPPETWQGQLDALLAARPVFAVLGGLAPGSWEPVHEFCESSSLPCLFPITDLPVSDESGYYSMYFSRGMKLEAEVVAWHLARSHAATQPVVQVYGGDDPRSGQAAARLRQQLLGQGREVVDIEVPGSGPPPAEFWSGVLQRAPAGPMVLWLSDEMLAGLWAQLSERAPAPQRIYLSTTLFGYAASQIPASSRHSVNFVHPAALPREQSLLLARSDGWLRANRILAPQAARIQADALFTLKVAGEAIRMIRGYFNREYFLERIEHMVENATFTSVYPTVSLAQGQRFVSKGAYIARYDEDKEDLVAVSDWVVTDSR